MNRQVFMLVFFVLIVTPFSAHAICKVAVQMGDGKEFLPERGYFAEFPWVQRHGFEAISVTSELVKLRAPLEGNTNPHKTAFAGTQALIGKLSGFMLVKKILEGQNKDATIVPLGGSIKYTQPIKTDVIAQAKLLTSENISDFLRALDTEKAAKISITSKLYEASGSSSSPHAIYEGTYLVMLKNVKSKIQIQDGQRLGKANPKVGTIEGFPSVKRDGLEIISASARQVEVLVPLEGNTNFQNNVFEGTQLVSGIVSGYMLVKKILELNDLGGTIVIHKGDIEYDKPMTTDMVASAVLSEPNKLKRFLTAVKNGKLARLSITSNLFEANGSTSNPHAVFEGTYAVVPAKAEVN